MTKQTMNKTVRFEIKQHIGVLSSREKGWTKEFNCISWDDHEPKYDIREWSPNHETMSKGITLTLEEVKELKKLLKKHFKDHKD